jgi:hypothetical protein
LKAIHWDEVPVALASAWCAGGGRLLAVWPAPVDHDACFLDAGFSDFADTDEEWERQVARLIDALMAGLGTCGPARMRSGEGLLASARDDNVPACVVEFGSPAAAALRTSDGHPIFWIWLGGSTLDVEALLRTVAFGTRLQRTSLQWDKLV